MLNDSDIQGQCAVETCVLTVQVYLLHTTAANLSPKEQTVASKQLFINESISSSSLVMMEILPCTFLQV